MKRIYSIIALVSFLFCCTSAFSQQKETEHSRKNTNAFSGSISEKRGLPFSFSESSSEELPLAHFAPPASTIDALLYCDFKTGIPADWDNWTLDNGHILYSDWGGNEDWITYDFSVSRSAALSSSFFYNDQADPGQGGDPNAGPAEDWLVSSSVAIPNDSESYVISWQALSGSPLYPETYEVRIIEDDAYQNLVDQYTDGDLSKTQFADALVAASALEVFANPETSTWNTRKITLDTYKGKEIRVMWRNHTDNGTFICISSVVLDKVKEEPTTDLALESFSDLIITNGWKANGAWKHWTRLASSSTINPNMYMDGHYAVFDVFSTELNEEGSLVSPAFTPSEEYCILTYEVQQIYEPALWFGGPGTIIVVEVSTDGGKTYTLSNENVLNELPNYRKAISSPITKMYFSLEDYVGKKINVRFRAISDDGWFLYALDNVRLETAPSHSDIALAVEPFSLTKIPYRHFEFIPMAKIYNYGATVNNEEATFKIETNFSYEFEESLPKMKAYEIFYTQADEVTTPNVGEITFTYKLDMAGDQDLSDNTIKTSAEITTDIFSVDNGELHPTKGFGTENGKKSSLGNKYAFLKRDKILGMEYAFVDKTDRPYSVSILDVAERKIIYTSEELHKPANYTPRTMIRHILETPLEVEAGEYAFLINQSSQWLGYAIDTNTEGSFWMLSESDDMFAGKIYEFGGVTIVLRAIVSSDMVDIVSLSPKSGSKYISLDTEVSVEFSREVTLADLSGITINNVEITAENIELSGKKLIIKHDLFEPETKYTVNIPVTATNEYDRAITWFFTTGNGNAVEDIESSPVAKVYPTICRSGFVNVDAMNPVSIKVMDLSGRVLHTQNIDGKSQIGMDYQNGIYLIVVENESQSNTYKIILQK